MERLFNATSITFGVITGFLAKLLGAWDVMLWGLVAVMAFDFFTGILKAIYTKTMSSEICYKGLLKKITILVIVGLANVVQQIAGGVVPIREIVIGFYIANEGISVLENAAVIHPNMPDKLKDILLQLRDKNDKEGKDDEDRY